MAIGQRLDFSERTGHQYNPTLIGETGVYRFQKEAFWNCYVSGTDPRTQTLLWGQAIAMPGQTLRTLGDTPAQGLLAYPDQSSGFFYLIKNFRVSLTAAKYFNYVVNDPLVTAASLTPNPDAKLHFAIANTSDAAVDCLLNSIPQQTKDINAFHIGGWHFPPPSEEGESRLETAFNYAPDYSFAGVEHSTEAADVRANSYSQTETASPIPFGIFQRTVYFARAPIICMDKRVNILMQPTDWMLGLLSPAVVFPANFRQFSLNYNSCAVSLTFDGYYSDKLENLIPFINA